MDIQKIAVIGAGTMGGAITHLAALSEFNVIMCDVKEDYLQKALDRMTSFMDRSIAKGKMTEDEKVHVLERITTTTELEEVKTAQFVIEAIIEDLEAKKDLFRQLDHLLPPDVVTVTNTSSMSITLISEATERQSKVAGMHFFNPPQIMKLVEVIRGYKTSDETVSIVKVVAQKMGKEAIEVKKDTPGFIVNRVMIPQFLEAIRIVEEGIASPEDVDKAVKLGLNYPMGPFELQDFAGVDIGMYVADYMYEEYKDDRFAVPLLLRNLVRAGRVGKKSGAGWYDY